MATSVIFFWFYFYFWKFSLSIHKNDVMMSRHPRIRFWSRKNPLLIECFGHHKFDDFKNLIQLFPMKQYNVLIEIKDVNYVIYNNFEYHEKNEFFQRNGWILPTSETLWVKKNVLLCSWIRPPASKRTQPNFRHSYWENGTYIFRSCSW